MAKSSTPAVVIGAGPYGLSAAAHLRGHGVQTRVFGDVMQRIRRNLLGRGIPIILAVAAYGDADWQI